MQRLRSTIQKLSRWGKEPPLAAVTGRPDARCRFTCRLFESWLRQLLSSRLNERGQVPRTRAQRDFNSLARANLAAVRVIHLTHDVKGGAARAAYRLHQALLNPGHESSVPVKRKSSADFTVIEVRFHDDAGTDEVRRSSRLVPGYCVRVPVSRNQ